MRVFYDREDLAEFFRLEAADLITKRMLCGCKSVCYRCIFQAEKLEEAAQFCRQPEALPLRPSYFAAMGMLDVQIDSSGERKEKSFVPNESELALV